MLVSVATLAAAARPQPAPFCRVSPGWACHGWGWGTWAVWGLGLGPGAWPWGLRGKDPGPRGPRFPGTYYQRANCKCAACEEQSRNSLEVDREKRSTMLMKSDHHHARRPVKGRSARAWACLMRMDLMRPFIRSRAPKTHASLDPPMALDRSKSTLPDGPNCGAQHLALRIVGHIRLSNMTRVRLM